MSEMIYTNGGRTNPNSASDAGIEVATDRTPGTVIASAIRNNFNVLAPDPG